MPSAPTPWHACEEVITTVTPGRECLCTRRGCAGSCRICETSIKRDGGCCMQAIKEQRAKSTSLEEKRVAKHVRTFLFSPQLEVEARYNATRYLLEEGAHRNMGC